MTDKAAEASHRRILFASLVGTAVEFYDFYIFATAAALVFGPLFFPGTDEGAQQLASYATFSVAFFARPLGGLIFGHFGDRLGRKSTLVASLMLMGLSTLLIAFLPTFGTVAFMAIQRRFGRETKLTSALFLLCISTAGIAFLPTYGQVGIVAPALLCLLRFGQGLGLGGEWGGASLLAVEHAPRGWENRYGSFPPMGAPVGFIASNGLFLLLGLWLSDADFLEWGWRIPFLLSAVLVILGLWVRLKISETPEFVSAAGQRPVAKVPVAELLRYHWRPTLAGTVGVIACFALFYLSTVFAIGYGTKTLGYGRELFLLIQLVAILFLAGGIILAGVHADLGNAQRTLFRGFVGTIGVGAVLPMLLVPHSPVTVFVWLVFALFVMGFCYGPLGGWLPALFPARVRYTGVSVTFNLGGIIGGGLTPFIAQKLVAEGGLTLVGYYLAGAGLVSMIGLAILPRKPAEGA